MIGIVYASTLILKYFPVKQSHFTQDLLWDDAADKYIFKTDHHN